MVFFNVVEGIHIIDSYEGFSVAKQRMLFLSTNTIQYKGDHICVETFVLIWVVLMLLQTGSAVLVWPAMGC